MSQTLFEPRCHYTSAAQQIYRTAFLQVLVYVLLDISFGIHILADQHHRSILHLCQITACQRVRIVSAAGYDDVLELIDSKALLQSIGYGSRGSVAVIAGDPDHAFAAENITLHSLEFADDSAVFFSQEPVFPFFTDEFAVFIPACEY